MICLFLEGYNIRAPYLSGELKRILKPEMSVCVIAFSFRENAVRSAREWERFYGKDSKNYKGITSGLCAYGISSERISFLNYFTDTKTSAMEKIKTADVLYFPGGLPDKMMERIREFELESVICAHTGIFMGYSAGALILLSEYHLSPDHDYPAFQYGKGLGLVDGFFLEVHDTGAPEQIAAIQKVKTEREKSVYTLPLMKGALLVEDGKISLLGKAREC
ncbi:MAG: hypothetical protein E7603_08985 [Ruminococcaceae bacterium]|nr:hypothetical protein [Oscillospiraceae bacterium]